MNLTSIETLQRAIDQRKYTSALVLLKELSVKGLDRQIYLWQSAVLEAKLGNLPKALHYAKELDTEQASLLCNAIEAKIPEFEELIEGYNKSVAYLHKHDYSQALNTVDTVFLDAVEIPLPIALYQAKLLLLALNSDERLIDFIQMLPEYALEDYLVRDILSVVKNDDETPIGSDNNRKIPTLLPYIMALAAITFSVYLYLDRPVMGNAAPEVTELPSLEEKVPVVEILIEEEVVPEEVVELDEVMDTFLFIPESIAKKYYTIGYEAYRGEDFNKAIDYLRMAIQSEEPSYFTDDAHYFLLLSYLKIEQYQNALATAEQFILKENMHYMESPYRDGVQLQEAIAIYQLGDSEGAAIRLLDLSQTTTIDWIRNETENMLKLVTEHD